MKVDIPPVGNPGKRSAKVRDDSEQASLHDPLGDRYDLKKKRRAARDQVEEEQTVKKAKKTRSSHADVIDSSSFFTIGERPVHKSRKRRKTELVAEERQWKDIPDWGNDTACQLLTLPVEVLDRCFALDVGLTVSHVSGNTHAETTDLNNSQWRDYVSLAGVSRMFRHQMSDDVWQVHFM
jgi:hypothetical protein